MFVLKNSGQGRVLITDSICTRRRVGRGAGVQHASGTKGCTIQLIGPPVAPKGVQVNRAGYPADINQGIRRSRASKVRIVNRRGVSRLHWYAVANRDGGTEEENKPAKTKASMVPFEAEPLTA